MTSMIRTRWAAVGAAIAVTLGAGGIGLVDAAKGSGERAIYTAIEPCRLLDTRPNQGVGGRTTPLGPGETSTIDLDNTTDECPNQPDDVVAVGLNVTALFATELTDLRFWAAGNPPNAANLNPAPGQPPTPNAVTTEVAPDGTFQVRNQAGNVHLVIDLVGIYRDHHHDDRYYTEGEIDDLIGTESTTKFLSVPPAAFNPRKPSTIQWEIGSSGELYVTGGSPGQYDQFYASVSLPDGATIVALHAWITDTLLFGDPAHNLEVELLGLRYDSGYLPMLSVQSLYEPAPAKLTDTTFNLTGPRIVDNEKYQYVVSVVDPTFDSDWGDVGSALQLEGVVIEYIVEE